MLPCWAFFQKKISLGCVRLSECIPTYQFLSLYTTGKVITWCSLLGVYSTATTIGHRSRRSNTSPCISIVRFLYPDGYIKRIRILGDTIFCTVAPQLLRALLEMQRQKRGCETNTQLPSWHMYCNYCIHWDTISFSICKKSHCGYTQVNIRAHMMEDEARADKELTAKMPDNLLLH